MKLPTINVVIISFRNYVYHNLFELIFRLSCVLLLVLMGYITCVCSFTFSHCSINVFVLSCSIDMCEKRNVYIIFFKYFIFTVKHTKNCTISIASRDAYFMPIFRL